MFEVNIEENDTLVTSIQQTYYCNKCGSIANDPVLPECGHLYCWKCIHNQANCLICSESINAHKYFSIFIQTDDSSEIVNNSLPPKPKTQYKQKIKNSNGGIQTNLPYYIKHQNNINNQRLIGGYGFFPPNFINAFSSFTDQEFNYNQESLRIKSKLNVIWISITVIITLLLFLS